jgi:predicted DNA-binding transcriptional regulator AlpA
VSEEVKVPRLLTTAQLAKLTNIPAWRILQLVKGRPDKRSKKANPLPPPPPHIRIGRSILFREDRVAQWINDQTSGGKDG